MKILTILNLTWIIVILLFCCLLSCGQNKANKAAVKGTTYKLYFLGGQSNMVGYGYASQLSEEYKQTDNNIMIFNGHQMPDDTIGGGNGRWMPLSPGFGTGCQSTNDSVFLSNRFGPELSFGKRIAELSKEKIAIIKYAKGGSSIALGASGYGTWAKEYKEKTTINQWDYFETTVKNAFANKDIDGDGIDDHLIPTGIAWMQGESDAYNEAASKVYFENLTTLMDDISSVFNVEKLSIVICQIEDSGETPEERLMQHIETVWEAQHKFTEKNDHVTLIRLSQPIEFLEDKWHYKSNHYLEMGDRFAEAFQHKEIQKPISGKMERIEKFESAFVTPRNIDVWLPENYDGKKKFSVLYMHDGNMLFDNAITWNKQSWDVDDIMTTLLNENKIEDAIVVGIWNGGETRHVDYFPEKPFESLSPEQQAFVSKQLQAVGRTTETFKPVSDNYLKFLVTELKPYIDKSYSVNTAPEQTFIAGSSMGGLISIYAICEYPGVFGGAACLSTHWPGIFSMENNPIPDAFVSYLKLNLPEPGSHKIYFDYGDQTLDALYPPLQKKVDHLMKAKGYTEENWKTQFFEGKDHSEISWSERFDIPLIFLLGR